MEGALKITIRSYRKDHSSDEMEWLNGAELALGRRTDLDIIRNGNVMAQRYANESEIIGDFFLWMHDKDRLHTARFVEYMLEMKTIQRMEWTTYSVGLNTIE